MSNQFEENKLFNYLGDLTDTLKRYNCYVAGGTITSLFTNRDINDIDIYFRDEQSAIDFLYEVWKEGQWVTALTKKAIMLKYGELDIQLIFFKYFNSAEEIFDTFDFTINMGAYDFKLDQFVLHDDFLKHNSQRILRFNSKTAFPIVSLLRVQKYQDRGYSISKSEFIRMILSSMNMKIESYEELKDQMGGMYGVNYDKLFEELKDGEFSLEKAIDIIADLHLSEDYFNKPTPIKFNSIDDIIDILSQRPVRYFELKNQLYKVNHAGILHRISEEPKRGELITADDFFKNTKFYKFVRKDGDKLCSFWNRNFEYMVGESIADTSNHGLYFNELKNISSSHYSSYKNGVLIETEIRTEDFISCYDVIKATQCKVLRIVPEEEYKHYLKDKSPF